MRYDYAWEKGTVKCVEHKLKSIKIQQRNKIYERACKGDQEAMKILKEQYGYKNIVVMGQLINL
jgi:hypothetical protein